MPEVPSSTSETIKTAVLDAFQCCRGKQRSKWHTQTAYLKTLVGSPDVWTASVVIHEDLDSCSQYDQTAEWAGTIEARHGEGGLEVRGMLKLVVSGVAYGTSAGTTVVL